MKLETNRKYCKHAPALYDCAECQLDADQKVVDELSDKIGILEVENAKLKTKVYKTSPMYIWKLENSVDNLTKELEAKLPLLLTPDEASFLTVCFDDDKKTV